MRILGYTSAIFILLAITLVFGGGCSNTDTIPSAGFSLTPSPVKVAFTDPQFRVEGSHGATGTSDPWTRENFLSVGLTMLEMSNLMAYIDNAHISIDLCTTRISNQGMVIRLVNLANRGVSVRIITEDGYFNDPNSIPLIQQLLDAGVTIRTDGDDLNRMMHENYWVIDSHIVLTGSGDMLDTSFQRSTNNTLIFDTPQTINVGSDVSEIKTITDAFFFDFTQMFSRGKFGKTKETMLTHTFKIGVDVEIFFGPNDDPDSKLRDELINADEYLFYAINQFTQTNNVWTWIDFHAQGGDVIVSGIFDGSAALQAPPNGALYSFPNMNSMNHKFIVIDVPLEFEDMQYFNAANSSDPVVVTGSCNWTNTGLGLNDETLIIVHDLTLAYQYGYGEATNLDAASQNTGIVYGRVRSANNNIGLEVEVTIETDRVSAYFPGTDITPVTVDSDPDDEGFYAALVPTGELFTLETEQPEGHLFPQPKFLYGDTFLLLPGASYEGNFYPKLAPSGTGTGGT